MGGSSGSSTTGFEPLLYPNTYNTGTPQAYGWQNPTGAYGSQGTTAGTNIPTVQAGMYGPGNNYLAEPINGLPTSFPIDAIPTGMSNIQTLYNSMSGLAPGYYNQAQGAVNQSVQNSLPQMQGIYNTAVGAQGNLGQGAQSQISGLENQNLGQVQGLLDNYNKNFVQQLGPQGQLGQQLMGEFNNYGITPTSGAFQSALGNQLGTLGAQNAMTLGQQALMPGIQAQYGTLNQTLGSQLGTSQQGAQQAGALSNVGAEQGIDLASQGALSPLDYQNQATSQISNLLNQETQLPIQYWGSNQNAQLAQLMGQQNANAQNSAAQMGMLGSLGGAGLGAAGKIGAAAAAGK